SSPLSPYISVQPQRACCRRRRLPTQGTRHRPGESEAADRAAEAGGGAATPQRRDGMTDWLGMAAHPKIPRPELKERVLARALAPRRRPWRLAAAAGLVLLAGAGAYGWYRTLTTLRLERDRLARAVLSLQDTLALVRSPDAKVVWVPVTTGGRGGGGTVVAGPARHRWPG